MTNPRLSHNVVSTRHWPLPHVLRACARADIRSVGLWREGVAALGMRATKRLLRETGLHVSSLCRAGFFPTADDDEARRRQVDNHRAVDEAAELGTGVLVVVPGGLPPGSRDLDAARGQVLAGVAELARYAQGSGVRLAVEPLHPALCSDRSVVVTMAQALDVAEPFPETSVGVMVDTFHVWWDPEVWRALDRARGRVLGLQVSDCPHRLEDPLHGRELPGRGVIDLPRFRRAVDQLGYTGPVEVEIFNREIWDRPGEGVLADIVTSFEEFVWQGPHD